MAKALWGAPFCYSRYGAQALRLYEVRVCGGTRAGRAIPHVPVFFVDRCLSVTTSFFAAFQVKGYRWLLGNAFATSAAWTVEGIAQGWLVLELTDSPFWVGAVVGVRGTFQLLFSMLGGTLADRWDRRAILLANYCMASVMALLLGLLIFSHAIQVWHLFIAAALNGAIGAANGPAYNALSYDVLGPQRLLNGTAFRFMAGAAIRVLSALAGGFIIELLGMGPNYVVVSGAYLLSAACLLPLRSPERSAVTKREHPLSALAGGLRYAGKTRPVRELLLLSLATEAFGFSWMYMKPVMARDVLQVGALGLGYLEAAAAAGQLLAMVGVASLGDFRHKGWLLLGSTFGYGVSIVLFGLSPWFGVSLALSAMAGGTGGMYDSSMNTVMLMTTTAEMRGRVLGLYVATWGSNQVGGFLLGALGTVVGVPLALAMTGSVVAANAARLVRSVRVFTPEAKAAAPDPPGEGT